MTGRYASAVDQHRSHNSPTHRLDVVIIDTKQYVRMRWSTQGLLTQLRSRSPEDQCRLYSKGRHIDYHIQTAMQF